MKTAIDHSFAALLAGAAYLRGVSGATTLFNGSQAILFDDASTNCLSAFNTQLDCDSRVQLLSYDIDRLNFTQQALTSLCTSSCLSSLVQLEQAVSSACGSYDFDFNGASLTALQVVDLYTYKYNMSCLADSSGNFCLIVEEDWNIGQLNSTGEATWPYYTNKTYPNFQDSQDGEPSTDVDGTLLDLSDPSPVFFDYGLNLTASGQDYYQDGISLTYEGHGWPVALEYDEYPLEIQCSQCFLAQYKLGIESQWGEVYDEVSDQVWNNVKSNCNLAWELVPAHNLSTWTALMGPLTWSFNPGCGQSINLSSGVSTANALALANNVPTASIITLNPVSWGYVSAGNYCAPVSCQVAVVQNTTSAQNFILPFSNISQTQFWAWNEYMDSNNLQAGEVVCIGPPGGAYTPVSATQADPTVYTTAASPTATTPSGTTSNCGLYYEVQSGDTCANVTLEFGITMEEFMSLNTEIYSNCSNLWLGYDYCVAPVNGSTTATPTTATSSTTTASACTTATAPSPTVSGTTSDCCTWYTVKSGDTCAVIEQDYGITLAQFRALNTYINEQCTNLWSGYSYCVNGEPQSTS